MAMIRYPGSKAKLVEEIVSHFPHQMRHPLWMDAAGWEYREPFFGSGAIGFEIIRRLPPRCSAWINDKDYGVACLWKAVQDTPDELRQKIEDFVPSAESFYRFKEEDGKRDVEPCEAGFRKLALHLMSFSGLGAMAGGPLGGKDQENAKYTCDCRWNPEYRMAEVTDLHELMTTRRVKVTNRDFTQVITGDPRAFYYCDPPYVEKGPELYRHPFADADHVRLAASLNACPGGWVVSYDDHATVRRLYAGHRIVPIDVKYTVATESIERRKNREILICKAA